MYRITCDGNVLYDPRGVEMGYSVHNPKVKLEVNTVGEGSFTLYNNHPNYDKLQMMKSVFEVSDETSVIFRGRMTENTVDFNHGMTVDMEGAMAYFNDSIINPFTFPDDFKNNANYIAAKNSGNVVAFLLGWFIDQHNAQVQDFQKFKLGNVTVSDPNNYVYRYNKDWLNTWETLKTRLFESELGGYLCIRYEADGNYIDYLSEFTETNEQGITFGENLLDLSNKLSSSGVFSAIIPIGAEVEKTITSTETSEDFEFGTSFETSTTIKYTVTLDGIADGNITDDIVKKGKYLYSKSAVERYGWICADPKESTFEDVKTTGELKNKAVKMLTGEGVLLSRTIEVSALDLHLTDDQIRSFRIYKNINVNSASHGLSVSYPLSKLDLDLLNPQNTKISVGKTEKTLTEKTASKVNNAVQKVEAAAGNLFQEVASSQVDIVDLQENTVPKNEVISSINQSAEEIKIQAKRVNLVGAVTADAIAAGAVTAEKINVDDLFAQDINMSGKFVTSAEVYLEPGKPEIDTLSNLVERGYATAEEIALWDFNGDGHVNLLDLELAKQALVGKWSIAEWSGAKLSTVTVTIDISNPSKAVRITGTNSWGRVIDQYLGANSALANDNYAETVQSIIEQSDIVMPLEQGGTGASDTSDALSHLEVADQWYKHLNSTEGLYCGFDMVDGAFLVSATFRDADGEASSSFAVLVNVSGETANITKINASMNGVPLGGFYVYKVLDSLMGFFYLYPADSTKNYVLSARVIHLAEGQYFFPNDPTIANQNAANCVEAASLRMNGDNTFESTMPVPVSSGGTGATTAEDARANIEAAPSGYGLGEMSKTCTDCNLATVNGFYRLSGTNCVNYPDRVTNFKYGAMLVLTRYTNATSTTVYQIAAYSGNYAMRHGDVTAGTWNDWEYLNPPLISGAEYKTTERYDGKAVYTKRIDVGTAPNATTKTISIGASGASIISCDAFLCKDTTICPLPSYDANTLRAYHWCSNGSLSIKTVTDLSSYNCYAIVKYTKD